MLAGVIHSDFEAGFICAEVMSFADLKEYGSVSRSRARIVEHLLAREVAPHKDARNYHTMHGITASLPWRTGEGGRHSGSWA